MFTDIIPEVDIWSTILEFGIDIQIFLSKSLTLRCKHNGGTWSQILGSSPSQPIKYYYITIIQYHNITILGSSSTSQPLQKSKCGHKCDKRKYIIWWHVAASLKVSQQKEDKGSYLILRGLRGLWKEKLLVLWFMGGDERM